MTLGLDKSTWKRVAFGDVIESVTVRVDDPSAAGVDRYVGLEHLDPGIMTVERWDTPDKVEAQKLRFHPGDVIFGRRRAYQKKVARADFEGICSAHALVLRARPGRIDPNFLPVFLSSDYFLDRAVGISVGSLSPTVNWRDLRAETFELPSLDQQQQIASLCWSIERHRQAVAAEETAARAALHRIRSEMFEGGHDTVSICEYFDVTIGRQRSPKHQLGDHRVPYLRSANVTPGGIDVADVKSMNFEPREQEKFSLQNGDVLVSEASGSPAAVGMPAVWRQQLPGVVCFQNTLLRFRAIEGVSLPEFVAHYCQWAYESGRFLSVASGTNIRHIGVGGASELMVRSASMAEQKAFVAKADEADALAESLGHELSLLRALHVSLVHEVFGGT